MAKPSAVSMVDSKTFLASSSSKWWKERQYSRNTRVSDSNSPFEDRLLVEESDVTAMGGSVASTFWGIKDKFWLFAECFIQ